MAQKKTPGHFHTAGYWIQLIKNAGGINRRIGYAPAYTGEADFVNVSWGLSKNHGKRQRAEMKLSRDKIAREMRKDGWNVKVTTDYHGYHIDAERYKKDKGFYLRRA